MKLSNYIYFFINDYCSIYTKKGVAASVMGVTTRYIGFELIFRLCSVKRRYTVNLRQGWGIILCCGEGVGCDHPVPFEILEQHAHPSHTSDNTHQLGHHAYLPPTLNLVSPSSLYNLQPLPYLYVLQLQLRSSIQKIYQEQHKQTNHIHLHMIYNCCNLKIKATENYLAQNLMTLSLKRHTESQTCSWQLCSSFLIIKSTMI